jgi:hypothetical protein
MNDIMRATGIVEFTVRDANNIIKQYERFHNIITAQGDALIADQLSGTNARTHVTNASGYIVIGTGFTGSNIKNQTWVMTQTGSPQALSVGYPQLQGTWGNTGQNIVIYQCLFPQGSLNVIGINEAAIVTASTQGANTSCLAYAQVVNSVNVSPSDTLLVTWNITFLGS